MCVFAGNVAHTWGLKMQAVSLSGLSMNHAKQQKLSAWVQGHQVRADGTKDTFYSVSVDVKRVPMRHHTLGLSFTATGYGTRIPTEYMVKFNDKWRRVYCRIFSNSGTMYIGHLRDTGERLVIRIDNE